MDLLSIKNIIEDYSGVPDICLPTRKRHIVKLRQIFYYLSKLYSVCSLDEMSNTLNQDHATAIYGIKTVRRTVIKDEYYKGFISDLTDIIDYTIDNNIKIKTGRKSHLKALRTIIMSQRCKIKMLEKKVDRIHADLNTGKRRYYNLMSEIPEDRIDDFMINRVDPYVRMHVKSTKTNDG